MALVVGEVERVDDPHPGVGQAVLAREPVDLVDGAMAQRVVGAGEQAGVQQGGHLVGLDGAVPDPGAVDVHLDERLEPEHPPRAVPDDLDVVAATGRLGGQCDGDLVGADGSRR